MSSDPSTSAAAPAHSAPDTPQAQVPAPPAAPPSGSPAAAVWAALTASPGATAAAIAETAGISRAAAGRELAALRAAGLAASTQGIPDGRRGTPAATWALAAGPAAAPGDATPGTQPGEPGLQDTERLAPAAGDPGEETAWPAAPQDDSAAGTGPAAAAGPDSDEPAAVTPGPEAAEQAATAGGEAEQQDAGNDAGGQAREGTAPENAGGAVPPHGAAPGAPADDGTTGSGPAPGGSASARWEDPAGAADDPGAAGQAPAGGGDAMHDTAPGLPADQAASVLRELSGAAGRALTALAAGDPPAALAEIAAIRAAAAESTRLIKAAAAGRASPATRPGGLRDLVDAHLRAHPGTDFTAGQIGKVLGRSAGAIANALDRLTTMKRADLTSESPRRYQATPAGR
jgi:hypothetical protein